MILVTGGCFQGKTDYACETFHIAKEEAADGMDCPMEAIYETKLLYHFHEYINRAYREKTGRVCCQAARRASEVHRVVCGIGTVIKHG